jgi:hypothetical protein
MAINFNDKVLITNPTAYSLGVWVIWAGAITIIVGIITQFTGDIVLPASAWCALGMPTTVIGVIFMRSGLTKNSG